MVIALPVPVIVSNFARIYQQSQQADKKIIEQTSRSERLKKLALYQRSAFLAGKKLAKCRMNELTASEATKGGGDNKYADPNKRAIWTAEGKRGPLNAIDEEASEAPLLNRLMLNSAQMQHYHILACLEQLTFDSLVKAQERRSFCRTGVL
ncbi:unnamed protein product [Mesocestoides corti]|uniref:Uncharacterized protein n=1 Tax=Mesocestoides corti TaxID=53468 RepID=A0A3P6HE56_MESCO|nr:unnamed protein product [Mesocestoides corti]